MISIQQAAQGFLSVGSAHRLEVLKALVKAGPDGLGVGQLQEKLKIPASTLAHHLRMLCDGGLIQQQKQGRSVVNRAKFDHIEELASFLLKECCSESNCDSQTNCT
ncbi:MAG: ArsR family transcriptional regulator [Parasphingorhabdus sp.]|jgi:ArsR family transcriptional regulator